MSDAKGNQEPSMEEILASIRRIISEDGEPKEESAAPAVNGHAQEEPEEDDDALVLTDMVVGESNVVELKEEPAPTPPPAPKPAPEPVKVEAPAPPPPAPPAVEVPPLPEPEVALPEEAEAEAAADIELEDVADPFAQNAASVDDGMPAQPVQVETPAAVADIPDDEDLISPDVAAASAATMAQLMARKPQTTQSSRPTSLDGLLVETLVRQAIEPMLKEWLDEHLQEIVERLVRREVERLSRKAELS